MKVMGPILLRIDGDARNIRIGHNVTLMPWVDLKVREQGKIILHDGVFLDSFVRLVAANDARVELGEDAQIGIGSVINAGADVLLGRTSVTAGYCTVISSEHRTGRGAPVMKQAYRHEPVYIGEECWLAAHAMVGPGSRLGKGAIVSAKSIVNGKVPSQAVVAGQPARVIKYRE